ncbi:MAG: hypothetical protein WKG52_15985 [Variovorax sp.]
MSRSWRTLVVAFVAACLLAAVWGALTQTQFNLNALVALGVEMPLRLRLLTSAQDLINFGPMYAAIVAAAWLPAFFVAGWLARRAPALHWALFPLAAGVALVVAIRAVDAVAPMPVLIDATRSVGGLLTMTLGSVLGGALFAFWIRPRNASA